MSFKHSTPKYISKPSIWANWKPRALVPHIPYEITWERKLRHPIFYPNHHTLFRIAFDAREFSYQISNILFVPKTMRMWEWSELQKTTLLSVCINENLLQMTMYNTKGEPIFDTAEGPRNDLHYNAFGNILLVCGFGNLARGKMEFWDVEKKKEIVSVSFNSRLSAMLVFHTTVS